MEPTWRGRPPRLPAPRLLLNEYSTRNPIDLPAMSTWPRSRTYTVQVQRPRRTCPVHLSLERMTEGWGPSFTQPMAHIPSSSMEGSYTTCFRSIFDRSTPGEWKTMPRKRFGCCQTSKPTGVCLLNDDSWNAKGNPIAITLLTYSAAAERRSEEIGPWLVVFGGQKPFELASSDTDVASIEQSENCGIVEKAWKDRFVCIGSPIKRSVSPVIVSFARPGAGNMKKHLHSDSLHAIPHTRYCRIAGIDLGFQTCFKAFSSVARSIFKGIHRLPHDHT